MATGGRMPTQEYGRPPQAKGVGADAKRHDLERPKTPGLHGSDLQMGDVQALEQGQRIAPPATQQPAGQGPAQPASQTPPAQQRVATAPMEVPDAIDFLAEQNGPEFNLSSPQRQLDSSAAMTWLPILRQLASGPGASAALVNAFINQARLMAQAGSQPATIVDNFATDEGIEAMLDAGIMRG